jgi:hypothetical protein
MVAPAPDNVALTFDALVIVTVPIGVIVLPPVILLMTNPALLVVFVLQ